MRFTEIKTGTWEFYRCFPDAEIWSLFEEAREIS